MTAQTQALAGFSLQVRKGNTWPLGVEEDQEGEKGRFWLAKTKDEPERLEGTRTFASQVFKEGWIVAKAQYYSLPHGCGPGTGRERVYKLLPTDTFPSLNHITRLDSSVALVVDSKSNSKKTSHGLSGPRTGRLSQLRCDERSRRRRSERRRRFLLHRVVPGLPSHEVDVLLAVVAHVAAGHTSTGICHGRKFCRIYIYLYKGALSHSVAKLFLV